MPFGTLSENDLKAIIASLQRRLETGPLINVGDGRSGLSQGSIQARMYALEREERLVQLWTETIQHDRNQLALATRRTQNSLLPISRLPDELLSFVFTVLKEDETRDDIASVLHVCHRWRHIALHQSSLWNRIFVSNNRGSVERAHMCLSRSAASRLHLRIQGSSAVPLSPDILLDQDISTKILEPHASRLASYSVLAYSRHRNHFFPLRSPTPHLRTLSITWQGGHQLPHPFLPAFAPDVRLTHLHLSYDHNAYIADAFDLVPVDGLESLHIDGGHDISVPPLLRRASSLTTLCWNASGSRSTWLTVPQPMSLPELESLSLRGGLPLSLLFDMLIAPKLHTLSVFLPDYRSLPPGANVAPGLLSGTSRFANLSDVTFRSIIGLTPEQFSSFLSMHPALETLQLGEVTNDRQSLDLLAPLELSRRPNRLLSKLVLRFSSSTSAFDRPFWAHADPPPAITGENSSGASAPYARFGYVLGRILGTGPGSAVRPAVAATSDVAELRIGLFVSGGKKKDFGPAIAEHPRVDFLSDSSAASSTSVF